MLKSEYAFVLSSSAAAPTTDFPIFFLSIGLSLTSVMSFDLQDHGSRLREYADRSSSTIRGDDQQNRIIAVT